MDLNVISKLTKLAGYGDLSQEITDLMSDDQVTEFETPYAYYGEFLERQQGYEIEKMVSYIFLKDRLRDENINLYQINDIEAKIRSLSAGDDPWLRMVDAVFNNRFNPVVLKDYILFMKMASIFNVDLPEKVRYNYFMENFNDIIRCKFKSDDVIYIFQSLNGIASENKSICFFKSLFEKKPTEKKIADMCKLGISAVDIQIIYSLLVIGDRKATNAIVLAFKQLFSCDVEWNDFEKSFVEKYWKRETPTKYEGSCYPYQIFLSLPKNLNNIFFITDNFDHRFAWRISLTKDDELIPEWEKILHHFEPNDEIFFNFISQITSSVKLTEKLLIEFPDINWVDFINEYPKHVKFLINNKIISITQVADMDISNLKMVIESFGFDNTFELLSILREKRSDELLLLFHGIDYKYVMTSRKLVDFVAQILSEISMVDFDEFLRTLLYNDSAARKLFSEMELNSLVESYREICKYYDNYRKAYRSCSSRDTGWLFDIYATAEEKKAKADAEEEKKLQDIISDIRRKMADNKNGIFGVEWQDFRICCYYSDIYIPVWDRLKEKMSIPTEICVCSQDEYYEMIENISYYARNLNFSISEFQDILNKIKIMED